MDTDRDEPSRPACRGMAHPATPLPILPIPSAPQLQWQLTSVTLFIHFGPNTLRDSEWGTGEADPSLFNPTSLNTTQWVQVAKDAGFNRVMLTAVLGTGDVIKELALSAKEAGVDLGLYLSPWDRHEVSYGKTLEYKEFYMGQMPELLTRYGEIKEAWLDSAKGEGEKDMDYFFDSWWIGDEAGVADSTCWSLFNRSSVKIGDTDPKYSQEGDPSGHDWVPAECDVSIRPGWFWHASEIPKSAMRLLDIYYKSVGRNCLLLVNVPPNSSGLVSAEDIKNAFLTASSTRGSSNDSVLTPTMSWKKESRHIGLLRRINLIGSSIDLPGPVAFNVLQVQEPIHMARIIEFHLEIEKDGDWKKVMNGTTVGYQRLLQFPTVESQHLKFVIDKTWADPLVSFWGLYMDTFSSMVNKYDNSSRVECLSKPDRCNRYMNNSEVLRPTACSRPQTAAMYCMYISTLHSQFLNSLVSLELLKFQSCLS
ncbi:hypothetical protein MANES_11G151202v8 [Manihot esculenta]|uniref:Uncharacterized protein n=1 Tax=Manihot esculenta TaxID=3983 RepID=A0ACB7GYS9_MANES|nr:hypothetical protein MANES_11G151202v8 [Manihot esculenta]